MKTIKRVSRYLYRMFLPESVRNSKMANKLKSLLYKDTSIYDAHFFDRWVEEQSVRSAGRIAQSILKEFGVKRVIDVGCGTGALLDVLRDRGCEVFGLEYADAALKYCHARRLNVTKFDVTMDTFDDNRTFDVAVSMEVAEHLPEMAADRYIDLLTRLSPIIIFTAAQPGQGGIGHINEQPPSYWISKFQQHRFEQAEEISQRWRENWKISGDVQGYYCQNLMIFLRAESI